MHISYYTHMNQSPRQIIGFDTTDESIEKG